MPRTAARRQRNAVIGLGFTAGMWVPLAILMAFKGLPYESFVAAGLSILTLYAAGRAAYRWRKLVDAEWIVYCIHQRSVHQWSGAHFTGLEALTQPEHYRYITRSGPIGEEQEG